MARSAILDATVFIDAGGRDNNLRHLARHLLSAAATGDLDAHVSVETPQEVFTVLARRGDRPKALRMARFVASSFALRPVTDFTVAAGLELLDAHDGISGRDALILATADEMGVGAVVTRDNALGQVAGSRWVDASDAGAVARLIAG